MKKHHVSYIWVRQLTMQRCWAGSGGRRHLIISPPPTSLSHWLLCLCLLYTNFAWYTHTLFTIYLLYLLYTKFAYYTTDFPDIHLLCLIYTYFVYCVIYTYYASAMPTILNTTCVWLTVPTAYFESLRCLCKWSLPSWNHTLTQSSTHCTLHTHRVLSQRARSCTAESRGGKLNRKRAGWEPHCCCHFRLLLSGQKAPAAAHNGPINPPLSLFENARNSRNGYLWVVRTVNESYSHP